MDLFSIQEDAGGGLVFWHAKGGIIRRLIEDYWKEMHVQVFFLSLLQHFSFCTSKMILCSFFC